MIKKSELQKARRDALKAAGLIKLEVWLKSTNKAAIAQAKACTLYGRIKMIHKSVNNRVKKLGEAALSFIKSLLIVAGVIGLGYLAYLEVAYKIAIVNLSP